MFPGNLRDELYDFVTFSLNLEKIYVNSEWKHIIMYHLCKKNSFDALISKSPIFWNYHETVGWPYFLKLTWNLFMDQFFLNRPPKESNFFKLWCNCSIGPFFLNLFYNLIFKRLMNLRECLDVWTLFWVTVQQINILHQKSFYFWIVVQKIWFSVDKNTFMLEKKYIEIFSSRRNWLHH